MRLVFHSLVNKLVRKVFRRKKELLYHLMVTRRKSRDLNERPWTFNTVHLTKSREPIYIVSIKERSVIRSFSIVNWFDAKAGNVKGRGNKNSDVAFIKICDGKIWGFDSDLVGRRGAEPLKDLVDPGLRHGEPQEDPDEPNHDERPWRAQDGVGCKFAH